jgi:glycosyltransferase involved in cell wall biosynthesis
MGRIEKVIFIKNAVETLGYFSEQIAMEFEQQGIDTYFLDYEALDITVPGLAYFAERGKTALLTFNFIGLSREPVFYDEDDHYIWEHYDMQYINILVDHPLYYHSKLTQESRRMTVICIDRDHVDYIKRFYPNVRVFFMPSAGNVIADINEGFLGAGNFSYGVKYRDYERIWNYEQELAPIAERRYDIVFTGNNVPVLQIEQKIDAMEEEYRNFYHGIMDDLLENPAQRMEQVMEDHIRREIGEVSEEELASVISGMVFIDIWVRSQVRARIVRQLAEDGLHIHVFGAGWELLYCKMPWNIIKTDEMVSSRDCVQAVRNAKISLNVMPWFKNGAHDRIFTAMLQKSVSLTDKSLFLQEEFKDMQELVFYDLQDWKNLPGLVRELLRDPELMQQIADDGYRRAYSAHTWRSRAQGLLNGLPYF